MDVVDVHVEVVGEWLGQPGPRPRADGGSDGGGEAGFVLGRFTLVELAAVLEIAEENVLRGERGGRRGSLLLVMLVMRPGATAEVLLAEVRSHALRFKVQLRRGWPLRRRGRGGCGKDRGRGIIQLLYRIERRWYLLLWHGLEIELARAAAVRTERIVRGRRCRSRARRRFLRFREIKVLFVHARVAARRQGTVLERAVLSNGGGRFSRRRGVVIRIVDRFARGTQRGLRGASIFAEVQRGRRIVLHVARCRGTRVERTVLEGITTATGGTTLPHNDRTDVWWRKGDLRVATGGFVAQRCHEEWQILDLAVGTVRRQIHAGEIGQIEARTFGVFLPNASSTAISLMFLSPPMASLVESFPWRPSLYRKSASGGWFGFGLDADVEDDRDDSAGAEVSAPALVYTLRCGGWVAKVAALVRTGGFGVVVVVPARLDRDVQQLHFFLRNGTRLLGRRASTRLPVEFRLADVLVRERLLFELLRLRFIFLDQRLREWGFRASKELLFEELLLLLLRLLRRWLLEQKSIRLRKLMVKEGEVMLLGSGRIVGAEELRLRRGGKGKVASCQKFKDYQPIAVQWLDIEIRSIDLYSAMLRHFPLRWFRVAAAVAAVELR
uniref:Uncharacterized protein n=1 Tax=Anopheles farauti TaxID=69004 RepID=A0A182QLQ4_9DIPT